MSDNLSKNVADFTDLKDEASKTSLPRTTRIKVVEEGGGLPLMQVRIQNLHWNASR
jgi:hypothetical protein